MGIFCGVGVRSWRGMSLFTVGAQMGLGGKKPALLGLPALLLWLGLYAGVRGVNGGEVSEDRDVPGRSRIEGNKSRRSRSRGGGVRGGSAMVVTLPPTAEPAGEISGVGEQPPSPPP